jgi:hypothetical protein
MNWITAKAWTWAYSLEEVRDHAQAERHLWTQAAACIGLAVLRVFGG